jgi:L-alanine-DL-glutamate epimerase-like enolase superfamily enzyme
MAKPTDVRIVEAHVAVEHLPFRAPLKFGGRIVGEYQIVDVRATVETRSGRTAVGFGSMPIGHVWAWPASLDSAAAQEAMRRLSERVAENAARTGEFAHPLDHGWRLAAELDRRASEVVGEMGLGEAMPRLAALVAASPVDAAIHDGFGKANGINSFLGLGPEFVDRDLAAYLNDDFRGETLDRYVSRGPKPRMPLYHLVGALDPLAPADVVQPIGDGLPETLGEWIAFNGLTHLKIKLAGDDLAWDVDRVAAVERVAVEAQARRGRREWRYSLDFNEKCRDVDYVLEFLARLRELAPAALERVQYIEQPMHRDLKARPDAAVHRAASVKPVVVDESLVDFESLQTARELGYTGVALKACKGQTESLLMAAAAQKYGMFLCVQDLTCPGPSFLHSAELAARIPGVAAIEGNARQYCPAGNAGWSDRFPGMFRIVDGTVETGLLTGPGLGH